MLKIEYSRANCPSAPANYNRGQRVEWAISYDLTGTPKKADNISGTKSADCMGYQIKSPKASLIEKDNCNGYAFGFDGATFYYLMSPQEFDEFASKFSYLDRDSQSGKAKRRIRNDSHIMRAYLDTMSR